MSITAFTPYAGLIGGALIGLSALVLMAGAGRIAGASGIFSGLLTLNFDQAFRWRLIFIIGLLLGAAWAGLFAFDENAITFAGGTPRTIIGGLIIGVGVTLGQGCTSGHGICGLARFSKRSLIATVTFMAVAIITVFISRHVMGA
jgi:uncharacterized protein